MRGVPATVTESAHTDKNFKGDTNTRRLWRKGRSVGGGPAGRRFGAARS